jgi:hypothetical protein
MGFGSVHCTFSRIFTSSLALLLKEKGTTPLSLRRGVGGEVNNPRDAGDTIGTSGDAWLAPPCPWLRFVDHSLLHYEGDFFHGFDVGEGVFVGGYDVGKFAGFYGADLVGDSEDTGIGDGS